MRMNIYELPDIIFYKIVFYLPIQAALSLRLVNKQIKTRININDARINRNLFSNAWYQYRRLHLDAYRNRIRLVEITKKLCLTIFSDKVLYKHQYFEEFFSAVFQQQNCTFKPEAFPKAFTRPLSLITSDMRLNRMMKVYSKPWTSHTPILIKSPTDMKTIRLVPKYLRRRPLTRETALICSLDIYHWELGNRAYLNRRTRDLDNSSILIIGYGIAILELLNKYNLEVDIHGDEIVHLDYHFWDSHLNEKILHHEDYDIQQLPKRHALSLPEDFEPLGWTETMETENEQIQE